MLFGFLISLLLYLTYIYLKTLKSLQNLQQNRYNRGYKYIIWLKQNIRKNFFNISLILIFPIILLFFKPNPLIIYISSLTYFILIFTILKTKTKDKLPLVKTARIKRLIITNLLIYLIPIIIISLLFNEEYITIYYAIIGLLAYLNPLIVVLANFLNRPLEKLVAIHFKKQAIKKLNSLPGLEVIGITGSYGKTSSKNILNDILNIKYNAYPSPKNYNTPFGLMITINEHLEKFTDYFIAEMGACRKHEIKELCDLVHPKYGIITKIGLMHLETFGSEENIQKTKFELIESLPSDGLGILNADDEKQTSYQIKNNVPIKWIGIHNPKADYLAKNIQISYKGTSFTVIKKGDKHHYEFTTKLLGEANIYNILAGIALGDHLNISMADLITAVKRVEPVEHRLEMKKYYSINIIDDAYNSNPVGANMALDVLKMMPGKRVVVTPGMIELGNQDATIHYEFGRHMSKCADTVILVGQEKTKDIYRGLIAEKFNKKEIFVINDVLKAFEMLRKMQSKKEIYALLENDLPDIFNEK